MKRTYVLITIDAEHSRRFDNGCWSHCVNGHFPEDLDEMIRAGAATRTERGYRLTPGRENHLLKIRNLESNALTHASRIPVPQRIEQAQAGLPLVFKSLAKFGMPAVVFLDATALYRYGRPEFRESVELILHAHHDLQFHIHPGSLDAGWFSQRGMPAPEGELFEAEKYGYATIHPLYKSVLEDFVGIAGVRPVAHRAGTYRISEVIIDVVRDLGFAIDSSLDILNRKGHVRIGQDKPSGNRPFRHRGVIEIPITAYRMIGSGRIARFSINKHSFNRIMLLRMHDAGVRVINYILHSNGLMQRFQCEPASPRAGLQGSDAGAIRNFEADLDLISKHPNMSVVTMPQLVDAINAEPSILDGPDEVPWIDARAERKRSRTAVRSRAGHLLSILKGRRRV